MQPRIMIIDDEVSICISLSLALQPEYAVTWETDAAKGLERLRTERCDLVLLDLVIGDADGIDILRQIKEIDQRTLVIMMTAYGSIRSSVSAIRGGAFTYLTKPLDLEELQVYIRQALEFRALSDNVSYLSDELYQQTAPEELLGGSDAIRQVRQMIDKLKDVDTTVAITGESGTGKTLAAKTIHFSGSRGGGHFVSINCAAMDEQELERQLFGYKSGAFPGAVRDKQGKLEIAGRGTLFLDEVGDLSPAFQGKLLRLLQERTYSPVGSYEVCRFEARVIAATSRNLKEMTEKGLFRRDLYYWLNVAEIQMPPLRERKQDISLLCGQFIRRINLRQQKPLRISGIARDAEQVLLAHDYPGNIRELENVIEYASIVAGGQYINAKDLPYRLTEHSASSEETVGLAGKTLQELEKAAILASYHRHHGKRKAIAAELGISERGLWNKLKEYDLE